jgi:hypothetical protein
VIVPSEDMTLADAKRLLAENGADSDTDAADAEADGVKDAQQPSGTGG